MSTLFVDVCHIENVKPHPHADRLDIIEVKGWQCISQKGNFKPGDKCVYFPPNAVIPETLAEKFGITKYCSPLPSRNDGTRPSGLRIKAQRLRGEPSFGFVTKPENPTWEVGESLVEYYQVTKYEPPMECLDGDAERPHPAFHAYTNIENLHNFPDVFTEGEEVVIMEKIHGRNARVGMIVAESDSNGRAEFTVMCGSHGVRRKEFDQKGKRSVYWHALTPQVMSLLTEIADVQNNVVLFGELYGSSMQDMHYGLDQVKFRAFDIAVNGKYLNWVDQEEIFENHPEVEIAPILYRGPFSWEKVKELTDGPTTLCAPELAGKFKGREGVVIRPVQERYSEQLPNLGRVILKSVSVDYLSRRSGTEFQ